MVAKYVVPAWQQVVGLNELKDMATNVGQRKTPVALKHTTGGKSVNAHYKFLGSVLPESSTSTHSSMQCVGLYYSNYTMQNLKKVLIIL